MFLKGCLSFLFSCFFGFECFAQPFVCVKTLNDNGTSVPLVLTSRPDAPVLIQGNRDGSISLRSSEDGALLKQVKAHREAVNYMGFNSTGRLLISTSADGEIKIFDFAQDKIIQQLYSPDYGGIKFALFSIADGYIYFNSYGRLYKTRSDLTQEVEKIFDLTQPISAGIITYDRSALVLAMDKSLYVINTRTDEIIQQIYTSDSPIEKLYLMPDSNLMTWSTDGTMRIWKMSMGQIVSPAASWFKAGSPGNVSFSHDGLKMITGNIGSWARIWTPLEKKVDQELFGHNGVVNAFSFSPDDKTIFTASEDQAIKIWKTAPPPPKGGIVQPSSLPAQTSPKEIVTPVISAPSDGGAVVMQSENVPTHINGRVVKRAENITVEKSSLDIYVFDDAIIDGDTLSLFFNNEWILKNYGVIREKKKITLTFQPNTNNYLVLFAVNLGTKPPNTAVVQFTEGKQSRTIRLSSDLSKCSAINFIYRN